MRSIPSTPLLVLWVLLCGVASGLARAADTGPMVLSYNADWPPYSLGHGDKARGILPDLLEEIIQNRLGIPVVHQGAPWKRAQEVVRSGDSDAMVTYASEPRLRYATASSHVVYTLRQRPVVKRGSAAETALRSDPDIDVLRRQRVCMMIGDGWSSNFYKQHHIEPDRVRNTQACLRMIAAGRADVFLHPEAVVLANMRTTGTEGELSHLPAVFAEMEFSLLLSHKSRFQNGDFLQRFDAELERMEADGSLAQLLERLHHKDYQAR